METNIPFKEQEANEFISFLDRSVRAGGLPMCADALRWHEKVFNGFKKKEEKKEDAETPQ